jgi:hypothetical protein
MVPMKTSISRSLELRRFFDRFPKSYSNISPKKSGRDTIPKMKSQRLFALIHVFVCCIPLFWMSHYSWASISPYLDIGGGYGVMKNVGPFFQNGVTTTSSGATFYVPDVGIWARLTRPDQRTQFQLGIRDRYEFGSDTSNAYTFGLNIPYFCARTQWRKFFITAGYSPYLWRSVGGTSATNVVMSHASGAYAFLGEIGLAIPVNPIISLGASATFETVNNGMGVYSPTPVFGDYVFVRFYFSRTRPVF